MTEMVTYRSRLLELPEQLRCELGEIALQKGMLPTSRRDKINELFNEYKIDFKSIGTGTNRHIIKYDGYVIKIALDKEGIADNRQEWVMSEQLAPHVAATFEISKGGNLLVADTVSQYNTKRNGRSDACYVGQAASWEMPGHAQERRQRTC